ncbi:protein MraZ [Alistipes sp. CAG:831]|nr:protein MraZ [Alistipes sp. CAG:831]
MEKYVKSFVNFAPMTKFVGEYRAKTDDKGRLVFPSAFKSLMDNTQPLRLVVKKNLFAPCLDIYTYQEWERESEEIKSRLNFFNRNHAALWRGYMSGRAMVEPDGKLGRISIPRHLLDSIGVEKEVVFAGNDHKIELWARDKYEASAMPDEEFTALAEEILG